MTKTARASLFGGVVKKTVVSTAAREDASAPVSEAPAELSPAAPAARYPKASTREGKRVVTAYLSQEAFRQLKMIAAAEDCQQQALLIEGINAVFEKRGKSRIA